MPDVPQLLRAEQGSSPGEVALQARSSSPGAGCEEALWPEAPTPLEAGWEEGRLK